MTSPISIKRLKDSSGNGIGLQLVWTDGHPVDISAKILRDSCPCATCDEQRGKQTHANPLGSPRSGRALLQVVQATSEQGYQLVSIWGIGNYALGLEWGDGHNSGIYSYPILRELSKS